MKHPSPKSNQIKQSTNFCNSTLLSISSQSHQSKIHKKPSTQTCRTCAQFTDPLFWWWHNTLEVPWDAQHRLHLPKFYVCVYSSHQPKQSSTDSETHLASAIDWINNSSVCLSHFISPVSHATSLCISSNLCLDITSQHFSVLFVY